MVAMVSTKPPHGRRLRPDLDGPANARDGRPRSHPPTAHPGPYTPILAMTANASAEDKDECLAAGMDGHLSKPIDLSLVVAAIRQALGKTGQAATQPEGAA